ncbi:MAG: ABC transporter permease [Deltaproteobacteria bacterium]|nr:ABC transporter permease [Deltaproteobacteria bacterium]
MTALSLPLIYKPLSFLRRDFMEAASYRLSFLWQVFGVLFSVVMFYFISRLFGTSASPYLAAYGGKYFPFVLIGIAFTRYLNVALSTFADTVRDGQETGTVEVMLITPTRYLAVLVYSSLWDYFYVTYEVALYLLTGIFGFGLQVGSADLLSTLVVLVLTICAFSAFGILSAAFVLVFKRGDPISFLFGTLSTLLGGVYYPVTILPEWVQKCSNLLPLTYALRAMRHAILLGTPVSRLGIDLWALAGFALFGIPVSLFLFQRALNRARKEGTLLQF